MADSRLRFGSNNANGSPSRVPLARISEIYDYDFDPVTMEDSNHNLPSLDRPGTSNGIRPTANQLTSPSETKRNGDDGCNPVWPNIAAYFGAAGLFLLGMNVSGLTLLSYPWIGNLLSFDYQQLDFIGGVIILQLMWCGHFIRRFAEVLFIHLYRRKMSFFESIGAQVYYWLFGFWIGWSINYRGDLVYRVPSLSFFVPGVLLFLVGEIGNFYCHWLLRQMRLKPSGQAAISTSKRTIPSGFLFNYISYPHYLFEIISWIGFYLACHTMAFGIFLLASIITLTIRAVQGHNHMKKEFNGVDGNPLFPASRKAIFPKLL